MPLIGAAAVRAALNKAMVGADMASREITTKGAAIVEAAAKRNFEGSHARGEPHQGGDKPNVVSGDLRRSIRHEAVARLGVASYGTVVGPSVVYGRRIELGFLGQDSRGRKYHQPPFPYFVPAVTSTAPQLQALAAATWSRWLTP